jgi:V8-like Glu-specific endopeptidase
MKIKIGILVALLGVVALFAGLQFRGTPTTAQTPQDAGNVHTSVGLVSAANALKYWTPERMAAAKPLMPALDGEPKGTSAEPGPTGPPVLAPGSLGQGPLTQEEMEAAQGASATISVAGPSPLGYSYPFPFTRTQVYDAYTVFPYRTVGKLFFTQGSTNYVCSAAVTNSPNLRLIWTAGHCVAAGDGHTWSTNVVFVPAYRNGAAPYGAWAACDLATRTAWFTNAVFAEDTGAIKACDTPTGTRIGQVVGYLGFAANQNRIQHWNDFGYPQAKPFTGKFLVTCQASAAADDNTQGSPATIAIGCDMTGGSSGGPWILTFVRTKAGANNYLNGLNSYKYIVPSQPLAMYGPYFGDQAVDLRNAAISWGF